MYASTSASATRTPINSHPPSGAKRSRRPHTIPVITSQVLSEPGKNFQKAAIKR